MMNITCKVNPYSLALLVPFRVEGRVRGIKPHSADTQLLAAGGTMLQ
jgi:hypothetical protein